MDCSQVREDIPAHFSGDLPRAELEAIGAHLATCDACMAEARAHQSSISLLKALPEISPSDDFRTRLFDAIDREPARVKRTPIHPKFALWIRFAAAASVLVAAVSFIYVGLVTRSLPAATVSHVQPGATLAVGTPIRINEPFTAPAYTVVTMPAVGSMKLGKETTIRFLTPRRVRLESGELFAEITPGGRGFSVAARDAGVEVQGTRFGVRSDGSPSTVYVLEGKVQATSDRWKVELTDRQMATVGAPAKRLEDEALRWIAANEAPALVFDVERQDREIRAGGPFSFRLALRSSSPAPVLLEPLRDLPSRIVLKIVDPAGKEYLADLGGAASPVEARQGSGGEVRVDVASPCILDVTLRVQGGFERIGRHHLSLSYLGSRTPEGPGRVLPGEPFFVEVRE